jgi:hypothetical protein
LVLENFCLKGRLLPENEELRPRLLLEFGSSAFPADKKEIRSYRVSHSAFKWIKKLEGHIIKMRDLLERK